MSGSICKILGVKEDDIFYDGAEGAMEGIYYKVSNGALYSTVDVALDKWIPCSASTLIDLIEHGKIIKHYYIRDILKILNVISKLDYYFVSRAESEISLYTENDNDDITIISNCHPIWNTICPIKFKIYEVGELIAEFERRCSIN